MVKIRLQSFREIGRNKPVNKLVRDLELGHHKPITANHDSKPSLLPRD
jgi:hypothetical protein